MQLPQLLLNALLGYLKTLLLTGVFLSSQVRNLNMIVILNIKLLSM